MCSSDLVLLKKAAGATKGSGTPNKTEVGTVTEKQVREIATQKMPDLNAASVDAAQDFPPTAISSAAWLDHRP